VRKFLVIVILFSGIGFAADIDTVNQSQSALVGAISGYLDNPIDVVQYIPDYGLHLSFRGVFSTTDPEEVATTIGNLLSALRDTVRGLDDGDYISVYYRGNISLRQNYELIVRMRQGQPNAIEIWLDGVRQ
jgi:hypothetical protein